MKTFLVLLFAAGTWLSLLCEVASFLAWNIPGMFWYGIAITVFALALKHSLWWADAPAKR